MVDTSKLIDAIDAYYLKEQNEQTYIRGKAVGAGSIGDDCLRKVAYGFKWFNREAAKVDNGRILRLFGRGHREEEVIWEYFRNINVVVHDIDLNVPEDRHNRQFKVKFADGHGTGFVDAFLSNISQWLIGTEEDEHVLAEAKTYNDRTFKVLQKKGFKTEKPEHYAQMLIYMWRYGVKHGLYCAVNKNTDELYFEYVEANDDLAQMYDSRARQVVYDEELPPKLSDDSAFFKCKFCNFRPNCHGNTMPDINCRTCAFATAAPDQTWLCEHPAVLSSNDTSVELSPEEQAVGCDKHAYHPNYIEQNELEYVEEHTDNGYVAYRVNGTDTILLNGMRPPVGSDEEAAAWRESNPVGLATSSENLFMSAITEVNKK